MTALYTESTLTRIGYCKIQKKESNSEIKCEQGLRHWGREDEARGGEGRGTPLFYRAKLFSFIKSE